LSGTPQQLFEQAHIAREEGVSIVMVAPMLVGLPTFYELVQDHLHLPVLGHPAFSGAARISPILLFGKLFRLFGCDAVIYPNYGGRFTYSQQLCADLAATARAPWGQIKPAMPVPAGGMTVERVPEMVNFYGPETMLLIGGGLLSAGDQLLARSRQFVQSVAGSKA
jgi:ribulose-bisphosphate carboxylase large chain